jgi:hypothetical protein
MSSRIRGGGASGATPEHTWAGQGTGRPCHQCGRPIQPSEIEYEVELDSGKILRFHFACQQAWEDAGRRTV